MVGLRISSFLRLLLFEVLLIGATVAKGNASLTRYLGTLVVHLNAIQGGGYYLCVLRPIKTLCSAPLYFGLLEDDGNPETVYSRNQAEVAEENHGDDDNDSEIFAPNDKVCPCFSHSPTCNKKK